MPSVPGSVLEAEREMETYRTLSFFVEGEGGRGSGPKHAGNSAA